MTKKISKITIYVENQQDAIDFWCNKFGFQVVFEQPMGPNMKWLEVAPSQSNETTFVLYEKQMMLSQNPNANISHPSVILSTTNVEETYEDLKSKGVTVGDMLSMPYGKMFTFHDNDGNPYLLREDK